MGNKYRFRRLISSLFRKAFYEEIDPFETYRESKSYKEYEDEEELREVKAEKVVQQFKKLESPSIDTDEIEYDDGLGEKTIGRMKENGNENG